MSKCEKCGFDVSDNTKFCPECGTPVKFQAPQPQQPQPQQPQSPQPQVTQQQVTQPQIPQQQQPQPQPQMYAAPQYQPYVENRDPENTGISDQDANENRVLAALSYLGPIMLVIALVANSDSRYIKYHANQSLLVTVVTLILGLCCIIPILGWIVACIGSIVLFVFIIIGIVNALKGYAKPLPIFGKYRIINF